MPIAVGYNRYVYDYSTQEKVKMMPWKDPNFTLNQDPFSDMCGTLDYDGAFFILDVDADEDASSVLTIVEKNTGGHFTTPNNIPEPFLPR